LLNPFLQQKRHPQIGFTDDEILAEQLELKSATMSRTQLAASSGDAVLLRRPAQTAAASVCILCLL